MGFYDEFDVSPEAVNSVYNEGIQQEPTSLLGRPDYGIYPKRRGFLGSIASLTGRAGVSTLETIESALEAFNLNDPREKTASKLRGIDLFKPDLDEALNRGFLKETFLGSIPSAFESIGPSLTAAGIGAGTVAGMGALAGAPLGPVGMIAGAMISSLGIMGSANYQQTYEDEIRKGTPEDLAKTKALQSGAIEGVGESLGDLIGLSPIAKILKKPAINTLKQLLTTPAKDLVSGTISMFGKELLTEVGQEVGQTYVRNQGIAESEQESAVENAFKTVIPTLFTTLAFSAGSHAYASRDKQRLLNGITSENKDVQRVASDVIYRGLVKEDKGVAEYWKSYADKIIANPNGKFDIDANFVDIGQKQDWTGIDYGVMNKPFDVSIADTEKVIQELDFGVEDITRKSAEYTKKINLPKTIQDVNAAKITAYDLLDKIEEEKPDSYTFVNDLRQHLDNLPVSTAGSTPTAVIEDYRKVLNDIRDYSQTRSIDSVVNSFERESEQYRKVSNAKEIQDRNATKIKAYDLLDTLETERPEFKDYTDNLRSYLDSLPADTKISDLRGLLNDIQDFYKKQGIQTPETQTPVTEPSEALPEGIEIPKDFASKKIFFYDSLNRVAELYPELTPRVDQAINELDQAQTNGDLVWLMDSFSKDIKDFRPDESLLKRSKSDALAELNRYKEATLTRVKNSRPDFIKFINDTISNISKSESTGDIDNTIINLRSLLREIQSTTEERVLRPETVIGVPTPKPVPEIIGKERAEAIKPVEGKIFVIGNSKGWWNGKEIVDDVRQAKRYTNMSKAIEGVRSREVRKLNIPKLNAFTINIDELEGKTERSIKATNKKLNRIKELQNRLSDPDMPIKELRELGDLLFTKEGMKEAREIQADIDATVKLAQELQAVEQEKERGTTFEQQQRQREYEADIQGAIQNIEPGVLEAQRQVNEIQEEDYTEADIDEAIDRLAKDLEDADATELSDEELAAKDPSLAKRRIALKQQLKSNPIKGGVLNWRSEKGMVIAPNRSLILTAKKEGLPDTFTMIRYGKGNYHLVINNTVMNELINPNAKGLETKYKPLTLQEAKKIAENHLYDAGGKWLEVGTLSERNYSAKFKDWEIYSNGKAPKGGSGSLSVRRRGEAGKYVAMGPDFRSVAQAKEWINNVDSSVPTIETREAREAVVSPQLKRAIGEEERDVLESLIVKNSDGTYNKDKTKTALEAFLSGKKARLFTEESKNKIREGFATLLEKKNEEVKLQQKRAKELALTKKQQEADIKALIKAEEEAKAIAIRNYNIDEAFLKDYSLEDINKLAKAFGYNLAPTDQLHVAKKRFLTKYREFLREEARKYKAIKPETPEQERDRLAKELRNSNPKFREYEKVKNKIAKNFPEILKKTEAQQTGAEQLFVKSVNKELNAALKVLNNDSKFIRYNELNLILNQREVPLGTTKVTPTADQVVKGVEAAKSRGKKKIKRAVEPGTVEATLVQPYEVKEEQGTPTERVQTAVKAFTEDVKKGKLFAPITIDDIFENNLVESRTTTAREVVNSIISQVSSPAVKRFLNTISAKLDLDSIKVFYNREGLRSFYDPKTNEITLINNYTATAVHELVHAATYKSIKGNPDLENRLNDFYKKYVEEIGNLPIDEISAGMSYPLFSDESAFEFLAQALSDTNVANLLKKIKEPKSFFRNLYEKFRNFVRSVLGLETIDDISMFDSVNDLILEAIESDPNARYTADEKFSGKLFAQNLGNRTEESHIQKILTILRENGNRAPRSLMEKATISGVRFAKEGVDWVSKAFGNSTETLRRISPKYSALMKKFEFDIDRNIRKQLDDVEPFLRKLKDLSTDDYHKLWFGLLNSEYYFHMAEDVLNRKPELKKEYIKVKSVLDSIEKRADDVGLLISKIENYFPRTVADYDGLMKYFQKLAETDNNIALAIKYGEAAVYLEGRQPLKEEEKLKIIVDSIVVGNFARIPNPRSSKLRSIREIHPKIMHFYNNLEDSLIDHIYDTNNKIGALETIGKTHLKNRVDKIRHIQDLHKKLEKSEVTDERLVEEFEKAARELETTNELMENTLSQFLKADKTLSDYDLKRVTDIFRTRFTQKGMYGFMQSVKNAGLLLTLGNPLAAITQIGDQAMNIYANGWTNALGGMVAAFRNKDKLVDNHNFEHVLREYSPKLSSVWLDKALEISQLKRLDLFGKEAFMQGALRRYQKMSPEQFKQKWGEFNEVLANPDKVLVDIKNNNITEDVMFVLYSDLADFQPINLSQTPEYYQSSGNGRILYMLKSYAIKALNTAVREIETEWVKGNHVKGVIKFAYFVTLLGMAGAGTDEIKDIILGKENSLKDQVVDNMLSLVFLSKYQIEKGVRANSLVRDMAAGFIPPTSYLEDIVGDTINFLHPDKEWSFKSSRNIPIGGRLLYSWMSDNAHKAELVRQRRNIMDDIKDGESAARYSDQIKEINKYASRYDISPITAKSILDARKPKPEKRKG